MCLKVSHVNNATNDNCIKNCNNKQIEYFEIAAKSAQKSSITHKHGCVIVLEGEIISTGWNHYTEYMSCLYSTHAEIDALSKIPKKKYRNLMKDMELYVVRIGPDSIENTLKYSKPCESCEKAILKTGIHKVFYSTNDEYFKIIQNQKKWI